MPDVDKVSAWTELLSPLPIHLREIDTLKRQHPLARSARVRLGRLSMGAMASLGIEYIRVSVDHHSVSVFDGSTPVQSHDECDGQTFFFEFHSKSILDSEPNGSFFWGAPDVTISVWVKFSNGSPNILSEKAILIFCRSIARDILVTALELQRRSADSAILRLNSMFQGFDDRDERFGTVIAQSLTVLSRDSSADFTVYCVPDDVGLFFEYYHSRHSKNGRNATVVHRRNIHMLLTRDLLDRLARGRAVQTSSRSLPFENIESLHLASNALGIGSRVSVKGGRSFELLLTPVQYGVDLTGVILQFFSSQDSAFVLEAARAAQSAAKSYSKWSRWAWQFRRKMMIVNPIFNSNETRIIPKQAFIIMPFGEVWSPTVEKAVRKLLADIGYNAIRADDMFGQNIMEDIWQGILRSEVVICDTTGRNPNVYYELGLCHAIGKDVILITQEASDIPFDVRHLRHVVYSNTIDGFDRLQRGLRGFLNGKP